MKHIFKTMVPLLAFAAFMWTGCSDEDDTEPTPNKPAIPTISVGEPALSTDNAKAVVTVTPSEETEKWYWKCEEKDKTTAEYTAVTGKEAVKLEIPISMDLTYTLTVYAENESGKSKEATKEFIFKYADIMAELVEFEIKHVSSYSMDVEVKKSAKCAKYVIGASLARIYTEKTFIESAGISLNPNESYPMQPYNWADVSSTFTERTLVRSTLKDAKIEESAGIRFTSGLEYTIAVYAVDADGAGTVFTKDITIPEPEFKGNVAVTIDIPQDKLTMESFRAIVSADDKCSRIVVGHSTPNLVATADETNTKSFDDMSEQEINLSLTRLGAEVPTTYTGPLTKDYTFNIEPETEYLVYVIPIDKEGQMGKVTYKRITTLKPAFEGTGEVTSVEILDQTSIKTLGIKLQVNDKTKSVRVLCLPQATFYNLDIDWVMASESARTKYWDEYTVDELDKLSTEGLIISHPGDLYFLRATTVDADGKLSTVVDLADKAGKGKNGITTKEKEEEQVTTEFNGKGKITLTAADAGDEGIKLTVTKGSDTKVVYMVKYAADAVPDGVTSVRGGVQITDCVKEKDFFKSFDPNAEPKGGVSIVLDENTETTNITGTMSNEYDGNYGGDARIFVTLDNDGKLSIADYYIYGYGTKNNHK